MYKKLPIFKASLDLAVYLDMIVKNQDRYHRYTIGSDLREYSKQILFFVSKANRARDRNRVEILKRLVECSEEIKILLMLAKELKVFKSFKQFEYSSKLAVNISKQAKGWLLKSRKSEVVV
jgi:hypothetical protein